MALLNLDINESLIVKDRSNKDIMISPLKAKPGSKRQIQCFYYYLVSNNIITICKVGKKHGYKISISKSMPDLLTIAKTKLKIDVVEIWDEELDCIEIEMVVPGKTYFGATQEDIDNRD